MKKIFLLAVFMVLLPIIIGCERQREGETINQSQTQLYIGNFEGGYGEEWLYAVKARFEEKYKDVELEKGKKGVQVIIRSSRNYVGKDLKENIGNLVQDVFFTEALFYYDFVNAGLLLDISDVVNKPLNYDFINETTDSTLESQSIEDKMLDVHKDFYKTSTDKYYALPFYQAFYGMIYDVQLFEEENLFIAAPGEGNSYGFVLNKNTPRSAGPDGNLETTYDNGLPATYSEFFSLLDYMDRKNLEPISWAGAVQQYMSSLLTSLWTDYEGKDQMMLNYTFDGTANSIISGFDSNNNPILTSEKITQDNGYLTYGKQAGRYHALNFLETLLANPNYYNSNQVFSPAVSHRAAQDNFLSSRFLSNKEKIGIHIDGSWWQNEAKPTFESLEKAYGPDASAKNRQFAFMPMPKVDETKLGVQTAYEANFSVALINANVEEWKQPLAKAFLQFVHTDESLKEFTKITNTFKPYDYTLNQEELNELTTWGQSLYHVHQNVDFVTPASNNAMYIKNVNNLISETSFWNSEVKISNGNKLFNIPSTAIFTDKITARMYYDGLSSYWTQQYWNQIK